MWFAIALLALTACSCNNLQHNRTNMPYQKLLGSYSIATNQVAHITHLDRLTRVKSVTELQIEEIDIPFVSRQFTNRNVWRVEFEPASLKLKSSNQGFEDRYQRKFVVLAEKETGVIVQVRSRYEGEAEDMRPEPPSALAEAQLRKQGEIYHGFPLVEPEISFVDALDIVLTRGIGSPFVAKEIDGLYLMHSERGGEPKAVWIITLRGIPPRIAKGPGGDTVPVWQRNHIRNVIDAMSGECLFATNTPQPE